MLKQRQGRAGCVASERVARLVAMRTTRRVWRQHLAGWSWARIRSSPPPLGSHESSGWQWRRRMRMKLMGMQLGEPVVLAALPVEVEVVCLRQMKLMMTR